VNFNCGIQRQSDLILALRQLGTPEDPFRPFLSGNWNARVDVDKYYILSHPEVDYNQLEIAVHDSSNGWVPYRPYICMTIWWTRVFLFFGRSTAGGDSATFAWRWLLLKVCMSIRGIIGMITIR